MVVQNILKCHYDSSLSRTTYGFFLVFDVDNERAALLFGRSKFAAESADESDGVSSLLVASLVAARPSQTVQHELSQARTLHRRMQKLYGHFDGALLYRTDDAAPGQTTLLCMQQTRREKLMGAEPSLEIIQLYLASVQPP